MTTILIMSDSHGWTKEVQEIKARHVNDMDAMIHCGDSELEQNSIELKDMYVVKGNMDFDYDLKDEVTFQVGNAHFFIAHGHMHQIKYNLMPISYRADELGANIVCFGHSHVPGAEKVGNKLFINPGSIRLPRSKYPGTYAILHMNEDLSSVNVHFYTKEGDEIKELSYHTSIG